MLGVKLREVMANARHTGYSIAQCLRWDEPRVYRLLNGRRGGSARDVIQFMTACRRSPKEIEEMLRLCQGLTDPIWVNQYDRNLAVQLRPLVMLETEAVEIRTLGHVVVPALLQTEAYMRALLGPALNANAQVEARQRRQQLLERSGAAELIAFLDESVLRREVGGRRVMSEQLNRLLELQLRKNIIIRVLPLALGGYPCHDHEFTLYETVTGRPTAHAWLLSSDVFIEDDREIHRYKQAVATLSALALSPADSGKLIATMAARFCPEPGAATPRRVAER
ncbi:XRE family transcriptional regulator [Pseudonocardiaceae bacterium YIM PH 21723]|nr:XRE family transcriptional regulator [Pseudonocardiaceae bacterium YIM PH 21723]